MATGSAERQRVYSVSEITAQVKGLLETSLPALWVEGEVSNFTHHSSGHMYFTLKDQQSQLQCVMFRRANARLAFRPEGGMKVRAWGRIKVYEPAGKYQLVVERMRRGGVGDLAAAVEELKRKLKEEGLFDPTHRQPLPLFPGTVAVVTSKTGAAVRDVIRVVRTRFPAARIVVVPAPVQGAAAVPGIVAALRDLAAWGGADVAVVGRGGGALEDLMAFNSEEVARAIYDCPVPVVSAVGHEIDFTIADLVADARAATPSNAGEIVVPDREAVAASIGAAGSALSRAVRSRLSRESDRLESSGRAYAFRLPRELIERLAQRVDELARRTLAAASARCRDSRARLERAASELRLSDPSGPLARGYAAVRRITDGAMVRSVADVDIGAAVTVTVSDGALDCEVRNIHGRGRKR